MRYRLGPSTIAFRLFIFIVVAQASLYGFFALLISQSSDEAVRASEQSTFELLGQTVTWSILDEIESARLSMTAVMQDDRVSKLFAGRDRDGLIAYLSPYYDEIKDRVVRFHFHLPDGTSFLRMHQPTSYGDQLLYSRPMIAAALERRVLVSGIELGRDGLGLRVIAPMFQGGIFIGAVEFGMDFDEGFVKRLQKKHSGDYFIFLFQQEGVPKPSAGTRDTERCPIAERSIEQLKAGEPVWSLDCSKARAVGLYPFSDYAGNTIGFIKAELLRIPLSEALQHVYDRLIVLGIIMVIVLGITVVLSINTLLKPLDKALAQMRAILDHILAGDVSFRGDVSAAGADFAEFIRAVNSIIAALRERESLLQGIIQGIPGVIYYVAKDYLVKWANENARSITSELEGSDIRSRSTGFFEREREILDAAFSTGELQETELCYRKGVGNKNKCWEHVAIPIQSADGSIDHVIRISNDVSARCNAESELLELNRELGRKVEEEVRKRQQGERITDQQSRLAAIGELATGMAHEITQPLNAISFAFENLRSRFASGTLDPAYFDAKCQAITADTERVRRVIDHVRLFARSAPEDYSITFNVGSCIESAITLTGVQFATHGIDIRVEFDDTLPAVRGNPFRFEQVILNLLSNARDSIEDRLQADLLANVSDPNPGSIVIRTFQLDGSVVVEMADNGLGLGANDTEKLFDPFYSTKAPGKGTGLGLSISFGIVQDMHGTIELLAGEDGMGAVARIRLPVAERTAMKGNHDEHTYT